MNLDIKIGYGFGNIKFGISKQTLKDLYSNPTEKDLYNASGEDNGYLTETWHYDNDEFSVSFDEEDGWRLTTITTSNNNTTFSGKQILGLNLKEIIDFLSDKDLGEYEIDDLSDNHINQKVVSFIESSINFWFIEDELTEIQWGVLWKDEDTPDWPS